MSTWRIEAYLCADSTPRVIYLDADFAERDDQGWVSFCKIVPRDRMSSETKLVASYYRPLGYVRAGFELEQPSKENWFKHV